MKCPYCGAPLGLDDKFCPYCGQPNTLAKKHQADMEKYVQEFQKTRSQVYRETSRFTRLAVPITILFVLFVLNLAAYTVWAKSWEIGSSLMEKKIESQLENHQTAVDEFLAEGNYMGLSGYYQANSLYYTDAFNKYQAVLQGADSLSYVFQQLQYTFDASLPPDEDDLTYLAESLSRLVMQIYQMENQYSYNREIYLSQENMTHIRAIQDQCSALLIRYAGLTAEDIASLPDLSESRIYQLLERRLTENL